MNIGEFCIKNKSLTIFIILGICVLGIFRFYTIPRLEDPVFVLHDATVVTFLPGASAKSVESLVTEKLEEVLKTVPEVDEITSTSMFGVSVINIKLKQNYLDLQPIWQTIRNKIVTNRDVLPKEAMEPIFNDEYGDVYGILVSIRGEGFSYRELKDVAEDLRSDLLTIPLVSKIKLFGVQDEKVYVEFSSAKLYEYGFTPFMIAKILQEQNTLAYSGSSLESNQRIPLITTGEFKNIDEIKNIEIQLPGKSESIRLRDIAEVSRGYTDPPNSLIHYNGEPSIVVAISMRSEGNISEFGETIAEHLEVFKSYLPIGYSVDFLIYQPKYVEKTINEFMKNLKEAIVLVFIVMVFFTGIRGGIITGILIPLSIFCCFIVMPIYDITFERISIAALIIALGILVDNGVVMTENLYVRFGAGQDRLQAVKTAVSELWKPLLFVSLTTISTYLPIPLTTSDVTVFVFSLFAVVAISLLFSWILSLTVIPFLCYYFLKPAHHVENYSSKPYQYYRNILLWCLQRPFTFLSFIAILFVASVWGFTKIPQTFFPPNERDMFLAEIWLPYGSDIEETAKEAKKLEDYLLSQPDVTSVGSFIGEGGPRWYLALNPGASEPNYALFIVNTKSIEASYEMLKKTREHLHENFPEVRSEISQLAIGPPAKKPIEIRIIGPEIGTLYEIKDKVDAILLSDSNIFNINDNWGEWLKEMQIHVNQQKAKRAGLTSNDIAKSLGTQLSGYKATEYREGKEIIPIVIRSEENYRNNLGYIENITVSSVDKSTNVPLLQVADTVLISEPSAIKHREYERSLEVTAEIHYGTASEIMDKITPQVDALVNSPDWPQGYKLEFGGEGAENGKAQGDIFRGVPASMAILLLALMVQFNSASAVTAILLTVPLGLIGITPGLWLTGDSVSFMVFLGYISLIGIIVSHSLVMLDRTMIEMEHGHNIEDSIFLSCQRRLRPVIATSVITAAGLLPLSLQGGALWSPMANTLIAGLMVSSTLTLVFCPLVFSLMNGGNFKNYKWNPDLLKEE